MRGRTVVAGLAAAVAGALVTVPALGQDASIGTSGSSFSPDDVSVTPNSTVTISNSNGGPGSHDLNWEDGAPGVSPATPTQWSTSRTFTSEGTFRFYCSVHGGPGGVGMAGVVRVRTAGGTGTQPTGTQTTPGGTAPTPSPGPGQIPSTDATAPRITRAAVTRRRTGVRVRLRLSEAARVTIRVRRGGRTVTRRVYRRRPAGTNVLLVRTRMTPGRLTVGITAVDAAGNAGRRTLRLRIPRRAA